jgi:hypothetical protein
MQFAQFCRPLAFSSRECKNSKNKYSIQVFSLLEYEKWLQFLTFYCCITILLDNKRFIMPRKCYHFYLSKIVLKSFKHIYLSSIAKQVLAIYINQFRVRFLEPTSTGVIWRNIVMTRLGLEPMIPWLRCRHLNLIYELSFASLVL